MQEVCFGVVSSQPFVTASCAAELQSESLLAQESSHRGDPLGAGDVEETADPDSRVSIEHVDDDEPPRNVIPEPELNILQYIYAAGRDPATVATFETLITLQMQQIGNSNWCLIEEGKFLGPPPVCASPVCDSGPSCASPVCDSGPCDSFCPNPAEQL